eukprot:1835308-Amphidinium_carterae.1
MSLEEKRKTETVEYCVHEQQQTCRTHGSASLLRELGWEKPCAVAANKSKTSSNELIITTPIGAQLSAPWLPWVIVLALMKSLVCDRLSKNPIFLSCSAVSSWCTKNRASNCTVTLGSSWFLAGDVPLLL